MFHKRWKSEERTRPENFARLFTAGAGAHPKLWIRNPVLVFGWRKALARNFKGFVLGSIGLRSLSGKEGGLYASKPTKH